MNMNQAEKIYVITPDYLCNNNCIMCFARSNKSAFYKRPTEDLLLEIKKAKKAGYGKIKFVGGEPTIRRDIVRLIKCACDLKFSQIRVVSNGRMFSNFEFCKKIIESGLNGIEISLHGHTSNLHNSITRTPWAFEQVIRGIRNMKDCGLELLQVNSVVSKLNYSFLKEMSYLFSSLGFKTWTIMDLIPDGNGLKNYKFLSVRLLELSKILSLLNIRKNIFALENIVFNDFPLCLFPASMQESNRIMFFNSVDLPEVFQCEYSDSGNRIKKIDEKYSDKFKIKVKACKKCILLYKCPGIWKEYLSLYGDKEVNKEVKILIRT